MVAVVAVVLDHLVGWPAGGFVGVDVFFVISGFLITGLLLREHEANGHISFTGFYRRRFKRIVPAATLTLVVTVLASFFIFAAARFDQTLWDAVWAFLFVGNWNFAIAGTDYFTSGGPVSPLQHFWSLSIEEQFYFAWPWLLLGVLALRTRLGPQLRRSGRTVAGVVLGALVLASFTWALFESATAPTWAYFSTFSRAWELGAGALLALFAGSVSKLPHAARPYIAWAGIAGIVASLFVVTEEAAFPAPAAALPVIATLLVIGAGIGGRQQFLWPLTNPVSVWFGSISYSLYLWHFPVIVLLTALIPGNSLAYTVICVIAMIALSVGSYYGIEQPIRRSALFEPRSVKRRPANPQSRNRNAVIVLAGLVAVTVPLVVLAIAPPRTQDPVDGAGISTEGISPQMISDALGESQWPAQELSSSYLKSLQAEDVTSEECFNNFEEIDRSCTYNESGSTKVAVIGDSIAMSWAPAVRAAFPEASVTTFGKFSCPFVDILVSTSRTPEYQSCLDYHQWTYQRLAELQPELVFVSNADFQLARLSSGAKSDQARDEWIAAMVPTLRALSAGGTKIVVLSNPVPGQDLAECATRLNTPGDCIDTPDGQYERLVRANRMGVEDAVSQGVEAIFIDTRTWFCDGSAQCPALMRGEPIRSDAVHMTGDYSTALGKNLRRAVEG
jgi:peptidoglycan/LPS O-acetylase OafA/YrhL